MSESTLYFKETNKDEAVDYPVLNIASNDEPRVNLYSYEDSHVSSEMRSTTCNTSTSSYDQILNEMDFSKYFNTSLR